MYQSSQLIIVSGGQTGVDLAALEAAEACGLPCCGWVPKDFTNEHGPYGIPERLRQHLKETESTGSADRTERNIGMSDGILTLLYGESGQEKITSSPGTQHGIDYAKKLDKAPEQFLFIDLCAENIDGGVDSVITWIHTNNVRMCAIGGPRESEAPGIQKDAFQFLCRVFGRFSAT
ncbi:hypothetical protein EMMF5_002546 [Cystobasidiomycetes sp. EMM_F5]